MMKTLATWLACAALSGCAMTKGFVSGAIGGVAVVDEITRGEAVAGSAHTELKAAGHQTLAIVTAWTIWPVSVTYAGLCGVYGAYQFWKLDRNLKLLQAEGK